MLIIKKIVFSMIFLGIFLALTCPAGAADIYVDSFTQSPGASGECTLGEAIQAANNDAAVNGCPAGSGADTIYLPIGTYLLTAANNTTQGDNGLPDITSNITIIGVGSDRSDTLITVSTAFRIFHITPNASLSLDNLTLNNGTATPYIGGAIHNNQATLNVSNCQILGSRAASGGGISNVMGTVTITDSYLQGNTATTDTGGGIYNSGGTVNITNSVVSGNSASDGDGGGIYNAANGTVNILSSAVEGNTAADTGGGIYNEDGTTIITASTLNGF